MSTLRFILAGGFIVLACAQAGCGKGDSAKPEPASSSQAKNDVKSARRIPREKPPIAATASDTGGASATAAPTAPAQAASTQSPATHDTAASSPGGAPHLKDPGLLEPSKADEKAPDIFKAKFTTAKGDFVIEVTRDWAPNGADRFYNLVKMGFFDDTRFFRAVPNFMVQFGISGDPNVSRAWRDANIQDDPVNQSNKRGFVTFAQTSMPNTRSTQVFINYRRQPASRRVALRAVRPGRRGGHERSSTRSTRATAKARPKAAGRSKECIQMRGQRVPEQGLPEARLHQRSGHRPVRTPPLPEPDQRHGATKHGVVASLVPAALRGSSGSRRSRPAGFGRK